MSLLSGKPVGSSSSLTPPCLMGEQKMQEELQTIQGQSMPLHISRVGVTSDPTAANPGS